LAGTRIDLLIGVVCTIVPLIIGTIIGLISGYSGGVIDNILMRIVDITVSFPYLVLVIIILSILGPGTSNLFLALIITDWIAYAKIVRGEVLVAKNTEFILAARALGYNPIRILTKHMLPNIISPAIIFGMSSVVMCILSAASLGYLGLGVQPPTPEWGVMIADGREFVTGAIWISFFPGLTIALVGISFALFGDGLSSLLRPTDR
jgi:peptide/nickel transport system permease protein